MCILEISVVLNLIVMWESNQCLIQSHLLVVRGHLHHLLWTINVTLYAYDIYTHLCCSNILFYIYSNRFWSTFLYCSSLVLSCVYIELEPSFWTPSGGICPTFHENTTRDFLIFLLLQAMLLLPIIMGHIRERIFHLHFILYFFLLLLTGC